MAASPGSRADFDSVIPWAGRLLDQGATVGDVMRSIYGVDFPVEFYVFDNAFAAGLRLPLDRMVHPWQILALADPSRQARTDDPWAREQEERAHAQHPDFVPLAQLYASGDAEHDDHVIGYDLSALRAGVVRVLGHDGDVPERDAELVEVGSSLFGVLHAWMSDHVRMVEFQYDSPSNFGFGSLDQRDVDRAAGYLRQIEALRRKVASA
jgi:hypothetical protein